MGFQEHEQVSGLLSIMAAKACDILKDALEMTPEAKIFRWDQWVPKRLADHSDQLDVRNVKITN